MARKYAVLGVGNAIVDVIAKTDDATLARNGITKGGMTLVDEKTADTLYAQMPAAQESSGGSSANSAAIAASLGGAAAFIGKIANDPLGKIFAHDIKAAGVDFETAPLMGGAGTARCLIMVTPDAERSMSTYLGACAELRSEDMDAGMIAQSSVMLLEGYLFDKPHAQEAFYEAARIAKAAGTKVALTLSDPNCVTRHHAAFTDFVQNHVDILFANEKEIKAFAKTDDFNTAADYVQGMCDVAVITRGGKGATLLTPVKTISVAPAKIEKLVDTTGAGDAFAGGFLYGYTHLLALEDCGRLAAFCAGQIISQVGARPLQPLSQTLAITNKAQTQSPPKPGK